MSDTKQMLERARDRFEPPEDFMGSLIRRRDRKEWNRRISAAVIGIAIVLLSVASFTWVLRTSERPADEPTPPKPPGIFSEVGGWITYGDNEGIYAVDPTRPDDPNSQIQLSTERGAPLAWSSDGSKLLILRVRKFGASRRADLFVLNADGTETRLTSTLLNADGTRAGYRKIDRWVTGGSFSPDGSQVVYSVVGYDIRSSIYLVDADGGTPRMLLTAGLRNVGLYEPTFSPNGTQIVYFDGFVGSDRHQLRVMNADGTDVRVVVDNEELPGLPHSLSAISWTPDGQRLALGFGGYGIYVVGVDGSGFTRLKVGAVNPYWSPDGSRISYQLEKWFIKAQSPNNAIPNIDWHGALEIAAADGTHVQRFGYGASGPWNPLVQPEQEVAEVPTASEGVAVTTILLPLAALLTLVVGAVLFRRRMRKTGSA